MNLINKLVVKNLKLNKKRSMVTVVGIILSIALITCLSTLVSSFKQSGAGRLPCDMSKRGFQTLQRIAAEQIYRKQLLH